MSKPVQTRSVVMIEKVLDATESLVARQGIGGLTMDGVAAEAGVSKGGVLHHFRSKDALVDALVTRKLTVLDDDLARHRAEFSDTASSTLRGMAALGLSQYGDSQAFPRALLLAAVETPAALERFRALFTRTLADVETEAGGRALDPVLLFAVMGLLLTKSLGIAELSSAAAEAAFAAILGHAGRHPE